MEHAFSLPTATSKKVALRYGLNTILGASFFFVIFPPYSRKIVFFTVLLFVIIAICHLLFLRYYRYVFISESGIRGRPTSGIHWQNISWNEPVDTKPAKLRMLQGRLFSTKSGSEIFIPQAILDDLYFHDTIETFAPEDHPLRRATPLS